VQAVHEALITFACRVFARRNSGALYLNIYSMLYARIAKQIAVQLFYSECIKSCRVYSTPEVDRQTRFEFATLVCRRTG